MKDIQFYKVDEPFGTFSNFADYNIIINGELWSTAEHYFQANKFEDFELKERIKSIESPIKASIFGNIRKNMLRRDWDEIKEDVMYQALFAKFNQHLTLKKELLKTGDDNFIYASTDRYWGQGNYGKGKNRLGKLLMQVRTDINKINNDPDCVFPPWIAFSKLPRRDLFWRMGKGAGYLKAWYAFLDELEDIQEYIDFFPAKDNWSDIYDKLNKPKKPINEI